jgi:LAO/AO transport system kinase
MDLLDRLARGDRAALARVLSLLESDDPQSELTAQLRARASGAFVVGVSGPPGAGKSTLINALVSQWRGQDERVAVLAVDPSSPISGGALLGDRVRMGDHAGDDGVFIRSVASRGHLGGLSRSLDALLCAVDVAGWSTVVLETVGTGQSEVEVADVADVSVVLAAPGLGDEVQALKAGLLEIADLLVVNKADHPLARQTRRQLSGMLRLRDAHRQPVVVLETVATDGTGLPELLRALEDKRTRDSDEQALRLASRRRTAVERHLLEVLWLRVRSLDPELRSRLVDDIVAGSRSIEEAALVLAQSLSSAGSAPSPRATSTCTRDHLVTDPGIRKVQKP